MDAKLTGKGEYTFKKNTAMISKCNIIITIIIQLFIYIHVNILIVPYHCGKMSMNMSLSFLVINNAFTSKILSSC